MGRSFLQAPTKKYLPQEYHLKSFLHTGHIQDLSNRLQAIPSLISSSSTHPSISSYYQKIYKSLKESGCFYNLDILIGPNDEIQNFYIKKWEEFLSQNYSEKEIEEQFERNSEEDSPESTMNHLKWLEQVGFRDVDVIRKYYNFCLYGGMKNDI